MREEREGEGGVGGREESEGDGVREEREGERGSEGFKQY